MVSSTYSRANISSEEYKKQLKKFVRELLSEPELIELFYQNPQLKYKFRTELRLRESTIVSNLVNINFNFKKQCKSIVSTQIKDIDATIHGYLDDNLSTSADDKPPLLCKFMKKSYAYKNINSNSVRFSSVGYYRKNDAYECTLPIDFDSCGEFPFEVVVSRIVQRYMDERDMDLKSIWDKIQSIIEERYYLGCFTDAQYKEHMWNDYADGDGVCVWFEPDYSELHQILYADYISKAEDIKKEYINMTYRIANEDYSSFKEDYEKAVRAIVNLAIMSFYTKKSDYEKESEWRMMVSPHPDEVLLDEDGNQYIARPFPGKIVKVESRMPD